MSKKINEKNNTGHETNSPWVDLTNSQELDGLSDASYMCDVETGVCGPVQELEKAQKGKDKEED